MTPNQFLTKPPTPDSTAQSLAAAAKSSGSKLRHAAIAAALLVVVGAAVGLAPRWLHRKALQAETRDLAVTTVIAVTPTPATGEVSLMSLPAEIKPMVEAPIYARATGYLKRFVVDIGATVKEGDLLAEIDTPELNQELDQGRAQLAQAQAALKLAKSTAARWAELVKTQSVSEQEAEEKQADLELKAANVEAAQANVRRLEDLKAFQRVTAPFAGTITLRATDVGQLIDVGSGKELFRLAQTETLRVFVRVPQTVAHSVSPGQMAELTIPEVPGRVFPAKVVRTAGALSADSRTLLVELQVDNSRGEIFCGTYAQVRFTEAKAGAVLTLPSNTLLFRSDGPHVGVVGPDNKIQLRQVKLGRDFGPTTEIISGVGLTDRVVLNPPDSLAAGLAVRISNNNEF
ncbi:MAG: efflux RND transporter periplasmic adaptor subunit [Verrucomicrobiota bacterium]|jgi:RND family efflux transporter MFP subunit